jgi:hypothetical protein
MKLTTLVGVLLLVLGIVALAAGRITYHTKDEVADIGPLSIQKEERKTLPLSPLLGGLALAGGVVLLVTSTKRA